MSWREGRRRTVRKTIGFTEAEWHLASDLYQKTKNGRGYQSFSAFARDMLGNGSVRRIVVATDPSQLRGEIGRIGSNINQIAHRANAADASTKQMLEQVLAEQKKLTTLFLQLNDDYERKVS